MKKGIELLIVPIIAFVALTRPKSLVKFSGSMLGKLTLVILVIGAAMCGPIYGLIAAGLMVIILEEKYEGYVNIDGLKEVLKNTEDENDDVSEEIENELQEEKEDVEKEDVENEDVENEDVENEEEDMKEDGDINESEDGDTFVSGLLSKIGITSSNERIDTERKLQQGKCSNQELGKM
jgi:DNA-binding transcriptional MerR regulator